jgi:hypothetical protein
MARSRSKIVIVAVILLVVLGMASVLLLSQPGAKFIAPPLPQPNGYDDFLRAASNITGEVVDDATATTNDLRLFLAQNTDALAQIKTGLDHECGVPLDTSASATTNSSRLQDLSALKKCARLLIARGRVAEMDGKDAESTEAFLDTLRLGCGVTRGGVVIDAQIGLAIQGLGLSRIEKSLKHLNAAEVGTLAQSLVTAATRCESASSILQRESAWARQTFGWRGNLIHILRPGMFRAVEQSLTAKYAARDEAVRRISSEATARAALKQ